MPEKLAFDFSRLSPAERLELAQKLWESVDESEIDWTLTPGQRAELDRRLDDPDPGQSWNVIRDELLRELATRYPSAA